MNLIRPPFALAAALLAVSAFAQPSPPAPPDRPRPPAPIAESGVEATLSGRVARWLVNPNGEVDGLLLDDGTQVGFPPRRSAALTDAVKANDTVEVTGRRSAAGKVVQASAIRSTRSGRRVDIAAPDAEAAPPPPRPAGALTAMSASGPIDVLLHTGRGDVNGALLKDGTIVRFPPHAATPMADALKPGATLYARGYGTRTPEGGALEATAMGSSAETVRELFTGARPGPGREAGLRPPAGPANDLPAPPPPPLPLPAATPRAPA